MADIRDLKGKTIAIEDIHKDSGVEEHLDNLKKLNAEGRIKGAISIYLTPEGWYGSSWTWSTGASSALMMIGALEALKGELMARIREEPETGVDPAS